MSYVTDIILSVLPTESEAIKTINEWIESTTKPPLVNVSEHAGGDKAMAPDLWIGSFNYFRMEEFVDVVAKAPWREKRAVQLWIQDENDDIFHPRRLFL